MAGRGVVLVDGSSRSSLSDLVAKLEAEERNPKIHERVLVVEKISKLVYVVVADEVGGIASAVTEGGRSDG
jgi:hypothetical protein